MTRSRAAAHILATTVLILAAAAVLAMAAVIWYLAGPAGEERIRQEIETRLGPALGIELTIASFETNVLTHARVRGVTASLPDGTTLATLAGGRIAYSLIDLVMLRVDLSAVELDSLRVTLHRDSTGVFSLPHRPGGVTAQSGTGHGGGSPVSFRLGRVTITGAEITYDDRHIPLEAVLTGIDARARARLTGGYGLRLTIRTGRVDHDSLQADVSALDITATYDGGELAISRAVAMLGDTRIEGTATMDTASSPVTVAASYTVSGQITPIAGIVDQWLPGHLKPLTGDVNLTGGITTDDGGILVTLAGTGARFHAGAIDLPSLTIRGSYHDREVTVDTLRVTTPAGGAASAFMTLALDSLLTHEAAVELDHIRADRLWRFASGTASPYRATVSAHVHSSGPLRDLLGITIIADMDADDIVLDGESFADLTVSGRYEDRVLSLIAHQDSSRIECALSVTDSALTGEFYAESGRIGIASGFLGGRELAGSAVITGTINGSPRAPEIAASFSGVDIRYQGFPADHIEGSLTYRPGAFRLGGTTVTGTVDSVAALTYPPLPGSLSGGFAYNGVFSYGDDGFAGEVSLDFTAPGYGPVQFDSGSASVDIRNDTVTIGDARLLKDALSFEMAGSYNIPGRDLFARIAARDSSGQAGGATLTVALADSGGWLADVSMTRIDIARIMTLVEHAPAVKGIIDGWVRADGTTPDLSAQATIAVDSLAMGRIVLDRIAGGGALEGGLARLDSLTILTPSGALDASGSLTLGRTGTGGFTVTNTSRIRGRLAADSLGVGFAAGYLPEQTAIDGRVRADVQWDGTVADPGFAGAIHFGGGSFRATPSSAPVENVAASLRLDGATIVIDSLSATSQGITLSGGGSVTVQGITSYDAAIDLAVNGAPAFHGDGSYDSGEVDATLRFDGLDLAALESVVPTVTHLGGAVRGQITVSGAPSLANIEGTVTADGLRFRPPMLDESVSNGRLAVTFDHGRASLDTLSLSLGGGTVTGSGRLTLDGNTPRGMTLALGARNIGLKKKDTYDIVVTSLSLRGSVTETGVMVDGDLVFGESTISKPVRTRDIIQFTRPAPDRPGEPRPIIDTTRLNIRVRDSGDIWVDNNLAKLKVHPELVIGGTPRAPLITGRFTADEGYIFYLDRKFDLTRCYIDFTDPNRNNPMLDIAAQTTITGSSQLSDEPFVITLAISGEAEDPRFTLTSNPALDQADILSVLTFGATRSELAGSSGAILQDRAQMLGSQQISNYLSREARSFLGLDDLSIQGNLFNTGKAAGPQLLASDTISDRLRITYTTTVGEQNEQSVRLDYRLSRFFSVEGQTNQDGVSGLDLKYRLKF